MFIVNDILYIFDYSSLPNILMFDKSGKYIGAVGARGHAKGEYICLWDVCVCSDGTTYALSYDNSILIYDKNNKFIRSVKLPSDNRYYRIVSCGNYFALSSRHNEDGSESILSFYDKSFEFIGSKVENLRRNFEVGPFVFNPLLSNKNKISYFDFYRNQFVISGVDSINNSDVYQFASKKAFGENEVVSGQFDKNFAQFDFLNNVNMSDDRLFGFATMDRKYHYFEFDINSEKTNSFIYSGLSPLLFYFKDGYYYAVFSADKLSEYQKYNHRNNFKNSLCNALDSVSLEINPMDNFYIVKMKHRKDFVASKLVK